MSASRVPKRCLLHACIEYAQPGESYCATHLIAREKTRRKDPTLTGRRGTSGPWRKARTKALARAKWHCEGCGKSFRTIARAGGHLEVHHVDGDAHNSEPENLQVLCSGPDRTQWCHHRPA
jgi:5-methylcytosine-specific restriction endonuclease McrA